MLTTAAGLISSIFGYLIILRLIQTQVGVLAMRERLLAVSRELDSVAGLVGKATKEMSESLLTVLVLVGSVSRKIDIKRVVATALSLFSRALHPIEHAGYKTLLFVRALRVLKFLGR